MDVTTTLSIADWLQVLLLGAITGATGQTIRQVASLKKILDSGTALDRPRIAINLLIGAAAGILGALALGVAGGTPDGRTIGSLIGIGYAGTDFIESFMRRGEPPLAAATAPAAAPQGELPLVLPPNAVG